MASRLGDESLGGAYNQCAQVCVLPPAAASLPNAGLSSRLAILRPLLGVVDLVLAWRQRRLRAACCYAVGALAAPASGMKVRQFQEPFFKIGAFSIRESFL